MPCFLIVSLSRASLLLCAFEAHTDGGPEYFFCVANADLPELPACLLPPSNDWTCQRISCVVPEGH